MGQDKNSSCFEKNEDGVLIPTLETMQSIWKSEYESKRRIREKYKNMTAEEIKAERKKFRDFAEKNPILKKYLKKEGR